MRARVHLRRVLLALVLLAAASATLAQKITGVETVGFTVSNMDRAVEFYSRVLQFQKTTDQVVVAPEFGQSRGVPEAKARVVRMKLGDEQIEQAGLPDTGTAHDQRMAHKIGQFGKQILLRCKTVDPVGAFSVLCRLPYRPGHPH